MTSISPSERGNAVFLILLCVALFASLTAAVTYSSQGGGHGDITEEKARVLASEVMDYGDRVSSAISKLRLRGCMLSQISFEHDSSGDYVNGAAPGNESCHIFSTEGGEMGWVDFSSAIFDGTWSAQSDYGEPIFTIKNEIPQMGTDGDGANSYDLIMMVEAISAPVCEVINTRANGSATINSAADVETKYDGTINTTGTYSFPAAFNGQRQACFSDSGGADAGTLTYYYVVVIR